MTPAGLANGEHRRRALAGRAATGLSLPPVGTDMVQPHRKAVWRFLTKQSLRLVCGPACMRPGVYCKEGTSAHPQLETSLIIDRTWRPPRCFAGAQISELCYDETVLRAANYRAASCRGELTPTLISEGKKPSDRATRCDSRYDGLEKAALRGRGAQGVGGRVSRRRDTGCVRASVPSLDRSITCLSRSVGRIAPQRAPP